METLFRVSESPLAAVMRLAGKLWPKPDFALADIAGVTDRTARYWLCRNSGMKAEALLALLRTKDGFLFLEAGMEADGVAPPEWWQDFKLTVQLSNIRAAQQRQREEIDQLAAELLQ